MNKTLWKYALDFFRAKDKEEVFTRQDYMNYMKAIGCGSESNIITLDNYRNYLTQAGYLAKVLPSRGEYKRIKNIPYGTGIEEVKKKAYDKVSYEAIKRKEVENKQ